MNIVNISQFYEHLMHIRHAQKVFIALIWRMLTSTKRPLCFTKVHFNRIIFNIIGYFMNL